MRCNWVFYALQGVLQLSIISEDLFIRTYNDFINLKGFSSDLRKFFKYGIAKLIPWFFWCGGCVRIDGYQMAQGVHQDVAGSFNVVNWMLKASSSMAQLLTFEFSVFLSKNFSNGLWSLLNRICASVK